MAKRLRDDPAKQAPSPTIRVSVQKRGWLVRRIRLTGDVEAVLDYDARGTIIGPVDVEGKWSGPHGGVVKVDGVQVVTLRKRQPVGDSFGAHLEVPGERGNLRLGLRAYLEFGFVPRIEALTMTVNGTVVYDERAGRLLRPSSDDETLPIPATSPRPSEDELPLPSESGSP